MLAIDIEKANAKSKLEALVARYNATLRDMPKSEVSEETIRTWLNEFLAIFNWDVQDINQVLQERVLTGLPRERLDSINSPHRKPDYILKNGSNIKSFLDAKSLDVDVFCDSEVAYQIRCYGWSAQVPCAFVSNFEQFGIFDTRYVPSPDQPATSGVVQISIDEYIDHFDVLFNHLWRDMVCANSLEQIYSVGAIEGKLLLDSQFASLLSDFRIILANNLLLHNEGLIHSNTELNYYVQVILDRIIFIRVCESKEIETQEELKHLSEKADGFWKSFQSSCYMEFYNHYDGAMFFRDEKFQEFEMDDDIFVAFINSLYYPSPYKFDVIPVAVIASIYEEFLGKQLVIESGQAKETIKDEYIKTNGAITTPEHVVKMICKQTISLIDINTIEDLLKISILDPCCGSGVFMVACYERLAERMIHILSTNEKERNEHPAFFFEYNGTLLLTIVARRAIMLNCIYGIDYDESAIEVAKMSLALKVVDGNDPLAWEGIGAFGERILSEIAHNSRLGNTLIDTDWSFTPSEIIGIKPFNIHDAFPEIFDLSDGFTYIVTNPPYVETKYYKAAYPAMHEYLSVKYSAFSGKADLAVLFIERCLSLLSDHGKIGMIVQRRWFRTDYGCAMREVLNNAHALDRLIDFSATDIFKGRIVYASLMVLSKESPAQFKYYYMNSSADDVKTLFENSDDDGMFVGCEYNDMTLPLGNSPWLFSDEKIVSIRQALSAKIGNLSGFPGIAIKDGIQALWKKMYHLSNVRFDDGIATGFNGFGDCVTVESSILRGVIYNRVFYPFKHVLPDAYCIFPYRGNSTNAIRYDELAEEYPLTYNYLSKNEKRIKSNVSCRYEGLWHTFTREHNHALYDVPKIVIPMTAKDTIATYVTGKGLYMDNSNMWFISIPNATGELMKAMTCIINSTVFSVLGKVGANPQSGGYYKFNKQFLAPIPFPSVKLLASTDTIIQLSDMYDEIDELQQAYVDAIPTKKVVLAQNIELKWRELDSICFDLYELSEDEISIIKDVGRSISRVELLGV